MITKVSGNGITVHNQFPLEGSPIETKNKIIEYTIFDTKIMFLITIFLLNKTSTSSFKSTPCSKLKLRSKKLLIFLIKFNFAHKERSYVEYDEFNTNRPENRLIKSTLSLLYRLTKSSKNKTDIKTLLSAFSEVPESVNYDTDFIAYGSDIDEQAIRIAMENASRLPIGKKLHFEKRDIKDFKKYSERGTVICNPPYGERLLDLQEAENLYRQMGKVFDRQHGWSYYVITPDEEFENCFGRKADKSRKLYNGMIKCRLYMYFK